jgi:hypothetical protein
MNPSVERQRRLVRQLERLGHKVTMTATRNGASSDAPTKLARRQRATLKGA